MKARIRADEQQIIDAYNKGAKEGYERGIKTGSNWLLYAVCLTLADIHGFRKKRLLRVIRKTNRIFSEVCEDRMSLQDILDTLESEYNVKEEDFNII